MFFIRGSDLRIFASCCVMRVAKMMFVVELCELSGLYMLLMELFDVVVNWIIIFWDEVERFFASWG